MGAKTGLLNAMIAVSLFSWGAWGIFDKKALMGSATRNVLVIQYLYAFPEMIITGAWLLCSGSGIHLPAKLLFWTGLGAATSTLGIVAYLVAMSKTEASYVLGITAGYPLVMQVLATVLLGEKLIAQRLLASVLIAVGVLAIGKSNTVVPAPEDNPDQHWLEGQDKRQQLLESLSARKEIPDPGNQKLIWLCLFVATVGWGVHGLFDKMAVGCGTPLTVMFARTIFDCFTFLAMILFARLKGLPLHLKDRRTLALSAGSTLCLLFGYISYLTAMSLSTASYVIVITGCYPLLMYIFALLFLKERLNWVRLLGVGLVVSGGLLVQFTQAS